MSKSNQLTTKIPIGIIILIFIVPLYTYGKNTSKQPNVVIMIADDISRDDFSCYRHPVIKTPNIDKLAANGIRFNNAVLTTSSCSPSRTSIITGRYPHNTGACELHSPLPINQVVFPKLLQKAGYYTAQAGKWHFGLNGKPNGIAAEAFDRTGGSAADGGGASGSERWVEYLEERPKNRPFFMWFAAHDAHRGWDNQIEKLYSAEDVVVPAYMVDNKQTREDLLAYYREVSRFDENVGKVVAELTKQGELENTLIIVMADNGRPFPRDKTRMYDSGILTPFVAHFPEGIKKGGQESNSLLSVIDIAPTIIELAGAEESEMFQGESFAELLKKPKKSFRKYAFAEHNWHDYRAYERMVRTEDFVYIENGLPEQGNIGAADVLNGGAGKAMLAGNKNGTLNDLQGRIFEIPQPVAELYNHVNDPNQFDNIIDTDENISVQKELKKVLDEWRKETLDSRPENLTPDWYDRKTIKPLKAKGIRGEMPGSEKRARYVKGK